MHFEQAYRIAPQVPDVANNLAWVLSNSEPSNLDRALDLINEALKARPNDLRFRDTRGRILVKLQRWSHALTDLEAALGPNPDKPELHELLAQVYDSLGSPELAAEHRRKGVNRVR